MRGLVFCSSGDSCSPSLFPPRILCSRNKCPRACPAKVVKADDKPSDKLRPVTLQSVLAKAAAANSSPPITPTKRNEMSQGILYSKRPRKVGQAVWWNAQNKMEGWNYVSFGSNDNDTSESSDELFVSQATTTAAEVHSSSSRPLTLACAFHSSQIDTGCISWLNSSLYTDGINKGDSSSTIRSVSAT